MIKREICTLCHRKNSFKIKYVLPKFNIVECTNCKLLARDIVFSKKEIEEIYSKDYFTKLQKDYFSAGLTKELENSLRVKDFENRFENVKKFTNIKKGKLLDVGCGTGVFLKIVRDDGWRTKGTEVSRFAAEVGKKKFNLDIVCNELKEIKLKRASFDIVTGWDLIEHVEEPGELIVEIKRILKNKGFVTFQTTMVDSLLFILADLSYTLSFGKFSKLVEIAYPVHHSNHFSRKTLKKLLLKNGFRIIKTMNAEMFYEETSLPKIFIPVLKIIGFVSKLSGRTIELFIIGQKK